MTIRLFDVQAGFGGARPGTQPAAADELLAAMDRIEIDRALVRIAPTDLDNDVGRSNRMLLAAAEKSDGRLAACPVVLPAAVGDVPPEAEQIDELIAAGAVAATIRPLKDSWSLAEWASRPLLTSLAERRLPILCMAKQVTLEQVADLAGQHPPLPIIVAGVTYRELRTLIPMLRRFDKVHLSTGSNFSMHRGIESVVEAVGAERLLFGTGFPDVEPMMAVTQLMYAAISDADRQQISARNIERLIAEVQR